ncbi:hypothetical protein [Dialister sp. i34-0019-2H8]|uniref:hypothetical protein n=1 Tax=Dialister sp. i34-0019-2H8 TaxID=3141190 RepID=UPI0034B318B1
MNSISIGYVDATGEKTLTCDEQPREEFRIAMQAMSFYYSDMAENYGVRMPLQAFFAVDKVVPKRDKKSGALKGVRLSGRFHIKDSAATQRFSTIEDITPTDNVLRIMRKIYDEAALYISGERREENLFKTSRDGEQESSDERANEE